MPDNVIPRKKSANKQHPLLFRSFAGAHGLLAMTSLLLTFVLIDDCDYFIPLHFPPIDLIRLEDNLNSPLLTAVHFQFRILST